jgi:hypothetical protein
VKILSLRIRVIPRIILALSAACCFAQSGRVPIPSPIPRAAAPRPSLRFPAPSPAGPGATATRLLVDVGPRVTVGIPVVVTVTAVDNNGNMVTGYTSTVTLTATPGAVLVSTGVLWNGRIAFAVFFNGAGNQTVMAKDTNNLTGQTAVLVSGNNNCWFFPIRKGCFSGINEVNSFFTMDSTASYFSQIKSIYNGASGSATLAADLATLNFPVGLQITATTNIQAGPANSVPPAMGMAPSLSATGAAQAAQNMLNGGNLLISALYPVIGYNVNGQNNAGNLAITLNLVAREGIDIQNFKAGTSTLVNSAPSHTNAGLEAYLVYNAINPPDPSSGSTSAFAGSVFLGGSYGYSYTSHAYTLDYGIAHQSNALAQISAGLVVNNIVKIAISRGFGPRQTYNDSTTNLPVTVNNFKTWSIGISYQSPAPPPAN